MEQYVTGSVIRALREKKGLTQRQLAERLSVSDKTVSKWETGKGQPDISLLEPLAARLGVSGRNCCGANGWKTATGAPAYRGPASMSARCAATWFTPWARAVTAAAASPCRRWKRKHRMKPMR